MFLFDLINNNLVSLPLIAFALVQINVSYLFFLFNANTKKN